MAVAVVAMCAWFSTPLCAQSKDDPETRNAKNDAPKSVANHPFRKTKVDLAVDRAIAFLVTRQDAEGWIGDTNNNRTAMTALAIMSMAAVGHQPTDATPTGRAMRKALEYVLQPRHVDRNGYLSASDGSRMYGHGIIALMLGELLGMGTDDAMDRQIAERLSGAVQLILRAQTNGKRGVQAGGWRYGPSDRTSDLSATVWQLMALRSAKSAGLVVPGEAIDHAVAYVKRCFKDIARPRVDAAGNPILRKGAFSYQPGNPPSYSMAAAGLLSLQVCGRYDEPEVKAAAEWLAPRKMNYDETWFFYGTYYYAQGMYQYQHNPQFARDARTKVESVLLAKQNADGSWSAGNGQERSAGRVYTTSLAVLSLSVKYHYLPIYQR